MDIQDITVKINLDTYIKKIMSEKIDAMIKEMREHEVKSNEEMVERNKKIIALLDFETNCINGLIESENK